VTTCAVAHSITEFHSPRQTQAAPTHLQTTTSYSEDQPEPLLSLLTSQHPLAASLINGSLSAYKGAQSYIPLAEWTERNVGLPLAGTIGRVTGIEGGIRRTLQARRDGLQPHQDQAHTTPDVEKGDVFQHHRRSSNMSFETLPAYNEGDRSPPYSEQQVVLQSRERQPPPGWRQQLVISTSGLGVAMSDESIRSLKYCLSWLRWANQRLDGAIISLKDLLRRWDEGATQDRNGMPIANMVESSNESHQAQLSASIAALKKDVLETLKRVVGVVSNYAGGALPENARNLVHRHLTSLPQRFSIASSINAQNNENETEAAGSAKRVMVLAQEGLDMMTQVTGVVNDTLVSAEEWCGRLGRRRPDQPMLVNGHTEKESDDRSSTLQDRSRTVTEGLDADTKMAM
jgi:transcriptional repressor OPI1